MNILRRVAGVLAIGGVLVALPVSVDFGGSDYASSWTVDGVVKFTSACAHPTHCVDGYEEICSVGLSAGPPLSGYNIHDGEDSR